MSKTTEVQEIYTKKADLYHRIFFDILKCDKAIQSFFQKENYLRSEMRVLDAGCGSGLITKILVDISKQKNLSNITFNAFFIGMIIFGFIHDYFNYSKIVSKNISEYFHTIFYYILLPLVYSLLTKEGIIFINLFSFIVGYEITRFYCAKR